MLDDITIKQIREIQDIIKYCYSYEQTQKEIELFANKNELSIEEAIYIAYRIEL
ncbi:MAG: hypothetical protein ACFFG0_02705 [Candidatus Thorarchaeota archaeon]